MQYYSGRNIVKATAMTRGEYNAYRGWVMPFDESPDDEGMLVEYTDGGQSNHPNHDAHISWSPKDVFDRSYLAFDASDEDPEFLQRLKAECAENRDRMTKLQDFLVLVNGRGVEGVAKGSEAAHLLAQQLQAMASLNTILQRRVELLEQPTTKSQ